MEMLGHDGILTIGAVSMPGSAPAVRLMMYPDGARRLENCGFANHSISELAKSLDDVDAAASYQLIVRSPLMAPAGLPHDRSV
jgi:hypothetical protein